MNRNAETWPDYWEEETKLLPMMERMTNHFYRASRSIMDFGKEDSVLDFGCGPGYLVSRLEKDVKEIYGVDISASMIGKCRKRFSGRAHCHFLQLDKANSTDLSALGEWQFSKGICLSVVQYFDSIEDLGKLIQSADDHAGPGALFLIADIPVGAGLIGDVWELLKAAKSGGFLFKAFQFLFLSRFSSYYRVRSSRGLLRFNTEHIKDLIQSMELNARILRDPLTFSSKRVHLLIKLKGKERNL